MKRISIPPSRRRTPGKTYRCIAPLALLACIFLSGCVTDRVGVAFSDDPDFKDAERLYLQGSYDRAITRFSQLILSPEEQYDERVVARCYQLRGACWKGLGKYSRARHDFEDAIKVAESAPAFPERKNLILESRIAIGDAYLNDGAYQTGDRTYQEILASHPPAAMRDAVLFRRYICSVKLRRPDAERIKKQIGSMRNFDERALRREFLEGGTPTPIYRIEPTEILPANEMLGSVEIIPRERWHAKPTGSNVNFMTPIYRITVHHTADIIHQADWAGSVALMSSYQKTHQEGRGWADIGYHYIIDRAGRIWEGRPIEYQGAHAGSSEKNRGNIGVCLMGDFNSQDLTRGQETALVNLLRELCRIYRIDPSTRIYTHCEVHATQCPGKKLQSFMDQYRRIYS